MGMKEMTVSADKEVVLTQAMLREAGLHGRLRLVISQGEIRVLPEVTTEVEDVVQELAGCLGSEAATAYDFHLKLGSLYEAR
jgi:hypothetical protein